MCKHNHCEPSSSAAEGNRTQRDRQLCSRPIRHSASASWPKFLFAKSEGGTAQLLAECQHLQQKKNQNEEEKAKEKDADTNEAKRTTNTTKEKKIKVKEGVTIDKEVEHKKQKDKNIADTNHPTSADGTLTAIIEPETYYEFFFLHKHPYGEKTKDLEKTSL
jgi:hypothetical protein